MKLNSEMRREAINRVSKQNSNLSVANSKCNCEVCTCETCTCGTSCGCGTCRKSIND